MDQNNEVLNAKEAAVFLKTHVETIRRMARRGEIPAFKIGKDWRFHRGALLRWSNNGGIGPEKVNSENGVTQ